MNKNKKMLFENLGIRPCERFLIKERFSDRKKLAHYILTSSLELLKWNVSDEKYEVCSEYNLIEDYLNGDILIQKMNDDSNPVDEIQLYYDDILSFIDYISDEDYKAVLVDKLDNLIDLFIAKGVDFNYD